MNEIVVKKEANKKISIFKRDEKALMPGSVYVQVIEDHNYCYLEEDEIKSINKHVKMMKRKD